MAAAKKPKPLRLEAHPLYAKTYAAVMREFRGNFYAVPPWSDAKILRTDPGDLDPDPGPFYDWLQERFGVTGIHELPSATGRDLIAFLTPRWDGTLRKP